FLLRRQPYLTSRLGVFVAYDGRGAKGAIMRTAALVLVAALFTAAAAQAQPRPENDSIRSPAKITVGAGALVLGVVVAAKSSETTEVTSPIGTTMTSTSSSTQLGIGLGIAGVGGIVLWDGLRSHRSERPSTTFGDAVGKARAGAFIRRW